MWSYSKNTRIIRSAPRIEDRRWRIEDVALNF